MKKLISAVLCTTLSAIILCSCSDSNLFTKKENLSDDYTRTTDSAESYNYNDGADTPSPYATYSSEITDFELRLFRNYYKLNNKKNTSFVINPVNTVLQLGLIANGASENTKNEIIKAIADDLSLNDINQCSSYFKSRMEAVANTQNEEKDELSSETTTDDKNNYVKLETNFFFNDITDIKSRFLQTNSTYYGADIFRFMFSDENALTKINTHFSDFANGDVISKLDEKEHAFSITASDIKDEWLEPYAVSDIEQGKFKSDSGEQTVNFMTSNETYIKTKNAQGIIKYTASNPLKLMLIMPDKDISLEEYISDFNYLEYSKLFESIDITKRVEAKIPEFSINSDDTANSLTEALAESGMYSLFTDVASFSELSHNDDMAIDNMYEIAPDITINAAGISGVNKNNDKPAMKFEKQTSETELTVEFNRPFIFVLLDNESNIPVYIGTKA